ncbi:MAG: DEAD/DEAH box helicase, partial [Candidatus Heimdallarchaeaceae archaeon]
MMSEQLHENVSLFQKQALDTFRTGENVLLVAPSSAGKTFIARTYLLEYFQQNFGRFLKSPTKMKVAMLFPYKSIAVQEFSEINEMVSSHGINVLLAVGGVKISEEEIRKANIVIGTYEKFTGLYFRYKKLQKYLKVLIIDEFHFLGTERGIHIEELIMLQKRLNVETQLILLSASLSDPSKIANWLKARLIIEEKRPVPLVYDCVKVSNIAKKLNDETIGEKQVLVFLNSRSKAEKLAEQIAIQRKKSGIVNNLDDFWKQMIESATEEEIQEVMEQSYFPPKLRKCITYGVAYHHAGLSDIVRILIEQLYAQGILDVIVTTSTLAAGVNLPADEVFYVIDYYPRFKTFFDPNQVFQALGRAGRLGLKSLGKGVLIANSQRALEKAKKKLFVCINDKYLPKFEPIDSYFGHYEQLVSYYLKLIAFEEEPLMLDENILLDYLKSSFWFQNNSEYLHNYSFAPLFSSLISTEGAQKVIEFYNEYENLLKISSNEELEIKEI